MKLALLFAFQLYKESIKRAIGLIAVKMAVLFI